MSKVDTETNKKRELKTISVKEFIDHYSYRIDMNTDYQRDKIWSPEQQEDLLDSIIENIDIPKLYLAEVDDKSEFDYECIDGKQRMFSLLDFFKPDDSVKKPLHVRIVSTLYTYNQLKKNHPNYAKQMEDYKLHFLIYKKSFLEEKTEDFINKIFRRLQLGIRLNAGEILKSYTGVLRDFIFKDISGRGPFLRNTGLSEKRFQKELALAQICFNSFKRYTEGVDNFARARTSDLEDFIINNLRIRKDDENLLRIKKVLDIMNSSFGKGAKNISGRASVISAYLFIEDLFVSNKQKLISNFARFYLKLLNDIKGNMVSIRNYKEPNNRLIMDRFQKYILQASVESYSIKRRHEFLDEAFKHYLKTGKIIGDSAKA